MTPRILLLGVAGVRARAYLQTMLREGVRPHRVILTRACATDPAGAPGPANATPSAWIDLTIPVRETLASRGIPAETLGTDDLNSEQTRAAVARAECDLVVFTGGGIVRPPLLAAAPRWVHVHPGRLPDQRGSTGLYWSLLLDRRLHATAFFLEPGLDTGPVIAWGSFDPPSVPVEAYDHGVDAWIRAEVLRTALRRLCDDGAMPPQAQPRGEGYLFYIIHPVLKHLAADLIPKEAACVHPAQHP